jgi:DNA-binding transcriptional ArsR family regulator
VDENQIVAALAALAQPVRLKVFRALVVVGRSGLTPGAMAEGLAIPANTLSFHLKELTNAGLVVQERVGRNIVYRAGYERMNALLGYLTENCCQGAACAVDAAAPPAIAERTTNGDPHETVSRPRPRREPRAKRRVLFEAVRHRADARRKRLRQVDARGSRGSTSRSRRGAGSPVSITSGSRPTARKSSPS